MTIWVLFLLVSGEPVPIVAARSAEACQEAIEHVVDEADAPLWCEPFRGDVTVPDDLGADFK